MHIKTFRAKSMPQALELVRQELGPEATVLHTRELNAGLLARMLRGHAYEIAATQDASVNILQARAEDRDPPIPSPRRGGLGRGEPAGTRLNLEISAPANPQSEIRNPQSPTPLADFQSLVAELRTEVVPSPPKRESSLSNLLTNLLDADFDEPTARDLIAQLQRNPTLDPHDYRSARMDLASLLEAELAVTGPIRAATGGGRVVALVGPTGVGKTTTIAKLAANYRLKEGRRVGLITVDTYRIAAVEQLGAYAEIIDLPMEVVSTPREMRSAVRNMRDFDLVLMDTAGRSPRDEVRIRELRSILSEAEPDEVHLVLSAAASARSLTAAAEQFAPVGVTAVVVTKLDEAAGLGHLVTLARNSRLPFSYTTDGQTVPDDIAVAEPGPLTRMILNLDA
jgi:flagellar biosynthesis protein FlhF